METEPVEVVNVPAVENIEGEDDLALRKGKRRAEDAPEMLTEVTDMEQAPEQKQKRQKRTERVPSEIKVRPVRERRQSSYSLARGFLDDKDFETMEKQYSKQEARRAAFYDTSSYSTKLIHPFQPLTASVMFLHLLLACLSSGCICFQPKITPT